MAEETYNVRLLNQDGEFMAAVFTFNDEDRACALTLRFAGNELSATEDDYFEALCRIREQLEPLGLRPYCYGASRNVFPSAMARQMGAGLQAYKMKLGVQAKMADLVSIFASGADVDPASVADQRTFFEQWRRSWQVM